LIDAYKVLEFIDCINEEEGTDLPVEAVDCAETVQKQEDVQSLLDKFLVEDLIHCLEVKDDAEQIDFFIDYYQVGDFIEGLKNDESESST